MEFPFHFRSCKVENIVNYNKIYFKKRKTSVNNPHVSVLTCNHLQAGWCGLEGYLEFYEGYLQLSQDY